MPARSDPATRRRQLAEAAFKVIVERGSHGVRLADVARRAGVAPSLVSYYFEDRDDLLLDATRFGIDRFTEQRASAIARIEDPLAQLEEAIHWAVPDGSRDADWIILMEFWARGIRRSSFQTVAAMFQTRARTLYASIIEAGRTSGRFSPVAPSEELAASLVAMIDGLSARVILMDPAITPEDVERLVLAYARLAVGVPEREGVA